MYLVFGITLLVIALSFYIRQIIMLLPKVATTIYQKLWSDRWLAVAFIPFFGAYIYKQALNSFNELLGFNLAVKRESNFKPITYLPTNWVLFQEQYDRKTSMHHGTEIKFLQSNSYYQFISSGQENTSVNSIYVEVARNLKENTSWASLTFQSPFWRLINLKTDAVIPIIRNVDNAKIVNPCLPSDAFILKGGESFIVGLSEYQIHNLPNFVLWWSNGDEVGQKLLDRTTIEWPFPDNFRNTNQNLAWKIQGISLIVYQSVEYTKVVSPVPVILRPGERIEIMSGDRFSIQNTDIRFWIDYQDVLDGS